MVFAQLPRGFSALLLLNRRKGYNALLSLKPRRLFISLPEQRNETKKFAGCRSRAKIFTLFLKKKNSLRSNSFFFFTEKSKNFFTLFHGGRSSPPWRAHRFAREFQICYPDHTFIKKSKGFFVMFSFCFPYSTLASGLRGRALRNFCIFPLRRKSCLSVSEFFLFRTSC